MNALLQDVRFSLRMLRRNPLVTLVAVGSLVVGLGATVVVFTLVNAVLLRPLPVRDPHQLVVVLEQRQRGLNHNFSYQDFLEFGETRRVAANYVAYSRADVTLGRAEGAEVVAGELVSSDFFAALGIRLRLGRGLGEADAPRGAAPAVVVSESMWDRIADRQNALDGQTVVLNGVTFGVVGVAAEPFRGMEIGRDAQFWAPLHQQPVLASVNGMDLLSRPTASWLTVIARLRPDATPALLGEELTRAEANLPKSPTRTRERRFVAQPGHQGDSLLPQRIASPLQLLLAAAALVLVVACANVAGLLLARAGERGRELALRAALGAGRARLVRLLTIEALLLGVGSTALAVGIGWAAARSLVPLISTFGRPVTIDVTADWRVIGFALAVGVLATLLFGLVPIAGTLRRTPGPALAEGGRSASTSRRQSVLRQALVVAQFALALGLVGAAMLLGRTLINLRTLPTGFDLDRLAVIEVDPRAPRSGPAGPAARPSAEAEAARVSQYVADGLARLEAVPGVQAVGYARVLPLDFGGSRTTVEVPGYTSRPDEEMELNFNRVTLGYFEALGLAARDGRIFDGRDTRGAPPVTVINETMARRYWPDGRAVGQTIRMGPDAAFSVIGVVPDVKYRMLREDAGPSFYLPAAQGAPFAGAFHVRTAGPPGSVFESLRRAVAEIDSAVPIIRMRTLRAQADLNVNDERLSLTIALALAGAALLLAAVGLYAAMSHAVARRTREIGVRLALGAVPRDVRQLVLGDGVRLALIGSVLGLGLAIGAGTVIRERLFGVSAADPLSLVLAVLALAAIALVAAWAPARRAARVDPVHALRAE